MPAALPSQDAIRSALGELGYDAFRPGQREAIETLLRERRLLLVAPTGGGKSLVYQLPSLLLPGTTVVVSPLISLMHDQVAALEERGVPATFLASTLEAREVRRRMSELGNGRFRLVYLAPERLAFDGMRTLLQALKPPLVAIDEAHCISEWGHDFRPEYLSIGEFLSELGTPRVLACTATATPVVRDEILAKLELPPDTPQLVQGFARPNLVLRAAEVSGARARATRVDALLAEALGEPGASRGTAIVYAPTRRTTERESERLAALSWRVAAYHAGLDGEQRSQTQCAFQAGELEVVVATNAFGMGIDRADVRAVVHLAPPGSIEAYYQEVGRAGRDGELAYGLLLAGPADLGLRRSLLERSANGAPVAPALLEHKWSMFLELMRWAEGGSCRHDAILRYFGDEGETLDGCGRCDVCQGLTESAGLDADETTLVVRKALSAVARIRGRFGLQVAARLLRGTADPRLESTELDRTPTFGTLAAYSDEWLVRLLRRCVVAGWVDLRGGDRPVVVLSPAGRSVMLAERPARLLLPPLRDRSAGPTPSRAARGTRGARASVDELLDPESLRLFEALRAYRLERARAEGVPPYVVASDRTLREIAALAPRSEASLCEVHGIGPAKLERYGKDLLTVVATTLASRAEPRGGS